MRVLVVDDSKQCREYLKDSIKSQGHEVVVANDGISGFESFKKFKPQVIFSDILMPKMNGFELLEKVKKSNEQAIFVMTTAFDELIMAFDDQGDVKALRLKADNFLEKPIRHADLFFLLHKYSATIDSKEVLTLPEKRVKKTYSIEIPSQLNFIGETVNRLILQVGVALKTRQATGLKRGLSELIKNAIMHGNLNIRHQNAPNFKNGMSLEMLCQVELNQNPKLANKKVRVKYQLLDDRCEWTIMDEGSGFDWKNVNHGLDPSKLYFTGIFLARFYFDKLEYLGCGNTVRATKYILKN